MPPEKQEYSKRETDGSSKYARNLGRRCSETREQLRSHEIHTGLNSTTETVHLRRGYTFRLFGFLHTPLYSEKEGTQAGSELMFEPLDY